MAWAVGSFGAIFRTKDGGKEWYKQDSQQIEPLYGVRFVTENEGWICGKSGIILHTANGGATWQRYQSPVQTPIYNIAIAGNIGWAVGDKGVLLHSTDGGKNWKLFEAPAKLVSYWMMGVSLVPGTRGRISMITGSDGLLITIRDGIVDFGARFKTEPNVKREI